MVHSFISSVATGNDRKVWEHLSHYNEIDAWVPRNIVFVNKDSWNKLDDETKKIMKSCAAEAKSEDLVRSKEYTTFTLSKLKKKEMIVLRADDDAIEETKKLARQ